MLSKDVINVLPERITERLIEINTEYLENIGRVIKKIGELRPTDIHQLQQMYNYGADMDKVIKKLSKVSNKNISEIYEMFDIVAKDNYNFSKPFFEARGQKYIPYEENIKLKEYVRNMAKQTVNEYVNLTSHTAFAVFEKDGKSIAPLFAANKDKVATSLSDTYTKVIDYAVNKVQFGIESYNKAMQDVVKSLAGSGIKTVDYATGYSRRLDTAVRQNILWGVKECNQQTAEYLGEQFGADGYEIDYHSNPRPSHAEMGGKQYSKGEGVTIDGVYYPPFSSVEHLLKEFGCLHFKWSVILGVSEPSYSEQQLENFKEADNKTFEFEGKEYTMYEGTQLQRKIETALREQRDILRTAKASGLKDTERESKEKISILTNKYNKLSKTSGLPTKMERTKSALKVDKSNRSGKITYKGLGSNNDAEFDHLNKPPKFIKTIDYSNKNTVIKELENYEKDAVYKNFETALVITRSGKVYECYGTADRVFPDRDLKEELIGASVSHNHPILETVYSFSNDDLDLFNDYELDILRGCDEKYTYELSRNPNEIDDLPDNWQSDELFQHSLMIGRAKKLGIGYMRWKNE